MKKIIFYWSPHLNPVGTLKSTLNSALSLKRYNNKYDVFVINACGEWNDYKKFFSNLETPIYLLFSLANIPENIKFL